MNGSGLSEVEETVKALEAANRALLHPVVVVWVSRRCCCCYPEYCILLMLFRKLCFVKENVFSCCLGKCVLLLFGFLRLVVVVVVVLDKKVLFISVGVVCPFDLMGRLN